MVDREAWRKWLERHHADTDEIWLAYYKKATGKPTVGYAESVEEALCFGWIDGIRKRLDDERYAHRFSPRRAGSEWSKLNVERARRLIAAGRMTDAGLAAFEARAHAEGKPAPQLGAFVLSAAFEKRLSRNAKASRHFASLPPKQQEYYVAWIMSAKKQSTRDKRFAEALALLEANKRLGMK
jgi:uncharacterized protein YdeI (YjbR/CyaY-like superfamily)